jgi:uncharacterized protein YidB (DUF937 family)
MEERTSDLGIEGQLMDIVRALIEKHGGVQGTLKLMEQIGLGKTAHSWISKRANLPICADQIVEVFGSAVICEGAKQLGLAPQDFAQRLALAVPITISQLTPDGTIISCP